MTLATGSRFALAYVQETTPGTTPTTPTMLYTRVTGCGLSVSKDTLTSNEIRSDGNVPFVRHGNIKSSGSVDVEVSYSAFDDFIAAALRSTWATDTLKNGTTEVSFTMEKQYLDIAQYQVFTGCHIGGMSLSVKPNAVVTGSFDIVGMGGSTPTGTPLDATPTAAATYEPFDSFTGTIYEGGFEAGDAISIITGIDLKIDNGMTQKYAIGSQNAIAVTMGKCTVTGTVSAFFTDESLLAKFIDETASEIHFTLSDGTRSYTFSLPNVKYTGGDPSLNGEDALTLSLPFQAVYDSSEAASIKIVRAAS